MTHQETLLLFDVHSLMNRAFYGIAGRSRLTAPDGFPTGALLAFTNMLLKYKEEIGPTHIVSAMDRPGDTFRHEKYEAYKAGRRPMPEDLARQIPLARDLLEALGFQPVGLDRYEADDLIGTLARQGEEAGMRVFIVTGDRDALQLVSDRTAVVLLTTQKGGSISETITPAAMREAYGVDPEQWLDVKALMGDASDNIPGVKGVGAKTALRLIQRYGSLDQVYAHLDEQKGALLANLEEGRELAYLSRDLATISRQAPLPQADSLLKSATADLVDEQALTGLLSRLDFRSFIDRLGLDRAGGKKEDKGPIPEPVKLLDKPEELLALGGEGEDYAFFLPEEGEEGILAIEGACVRIKEAQEILDLLEEGTAALVTWDYKSQLRKAGRGAPDRPVADLMIGAYLLNQLGRGDDIDYALRAILGGDFQEDTDQALPLLADPWERKKKLAVQFPAAVRSQRADVSERGLDRLYQVETALVGILANMEGKGVLIDLEALEEASAEMAGELASLEADIHREAGHSFNINSPQQLAEILFVDLKLPPGRKGASGQYSTAASELERLKGYHVIIDQILEFREFSKLRSTFLEGLKKEIAPDGRVHTSYNQALVSTGRLSSSNPNLQNIPVRTERGRRIRELFIAPAGRLLVGADYSQIELRLLAHLSKDQNLTQAFLDGRDVHRVTAATLYGKDEDEITQAERSVAKTVNFSITYGISNFGLSRDLGISLQEAHRFIERFHAKYPGVEAWLERQGEEAKEKGYVETLFHRRRYMPELQSQNRNVFNFGLRAAMNAPVQGTAADLIKMAMVQVDRSLKEEGLEAAIILQVHDELILEVVEKDADRAGELLKEAMEGAMTLDVPLLAGTKKGRTWGDMI